MRDVLVLAVVALGTYLLRAAFLLRSQGSSPEAVERYVPFVGPAVLAALVAPGLWAPAGTASVAETAPALAAAVLSWLLWRRTERLPIALLGGLGSWWVLGALVELA
jgi:branched-subunit amino acid transport protein